MNGSRPTHRFPNFQQVQAIGAMVPELLSQSTRWEVVRTYRNCGYCRGDDDQLICIGNERIGRGPFTITCGPALPFPDRVNRYSTVLLATDGRLADESGQFSLDFGNAPLWQAGFTTPAPDPSVLADDLELLGEIALRFAPAESLGVLIPVINGILLQLPMSTTSVTALVHRQVLDSIVQLRQTAVRSCQDLPADAAACLERLIGLGYGLTPSGDDFCAGYLLGLIKMQQPRAALSLAGLLEHAAQRRTTTVSLAFFRALARGLLTESNQRLLDCLGNRDCSDRRQTLLDACDSGGTSGWDTLAGLVFGIEQATTMIQHTHDQPLPYPAPREISGRCAVM